jgi:hypothetical protein
VDVHGSSDKGAYNASNISYLNSPLPQLSFISSPYTGTVSTITIFAFPILALFFSKSTITISWNLELYEIQVPVPINKALSKCSNSHSFTYCLWLHINRSG